MINVIKATEIMRKYCPETKLEIKDGCDKAIHFGIIESVEKEVKRKWQINLKRKWEWNGKTYHHVEE